MIKQYNDPMKENQTLPLLFATVSGGTTEFILTQTWVTALLMAAAGAAVGWLTTQALNWMKSKIINRNKHETVPD